jgi:hypothetical protein
MGLYRKVIEGFIKGSILEVSMRAVRLWWGVKVKAGATRGPSVLGARREHVFSITHNTLQNSS